MRLFQGPFFLENKHQTTEPKARGRKTDLVAKVSSAVQLFQGTEEIRFISRCQAGSISIPGAAMRVG
jgi:hypothetical protein